MSANVNIFEFQADNEFDNGRVKHASDNDQIDFVIFGKKKID